MRPKTYSPGGDDPDAFRRERELALRAEADVSGAGGEGRRYVQLESEEDETWGPAPPKTNPKGRLGLFLRTLRHEGRRATPGMGAGDRRLMEDTGVLPTEESPFQRRRRMLETARRRALDRRTAGEAGALGRVVASAPLPWLVPGVRGRLLAAEHRAGTRAAERAAHFRLLAGSNRAAAGLVRSRTAYMVELARARAVSAERAQAVASMPRVPGVVPLSSAEWLRERDAATRAYVLRAMR